MACSRAFSLSFSYISCSQLSSNFKLRAGLRYSPQLTSLNPTLRRCCSSQKPKDTLAVSFALCSEDGVDDSHSLESNQSLPIKSISCIEYRDSLAADGLVTGSSIVGFVGATYLTLMKLSGVAISCPPGASSCSDVAGFGTFLKIAGLDLTQWLLLGSTSALAGAILYLTYILTTKLEGVSCTYGVASVILSFGSLLLSLRARVHSPASLQSWIANSFNSQKVKQVAGLHLAMSALVVLALSSTYTGTALALNVSTDIDLPPVEPEVTTSSSTSNLSLAKHLQSVGAKMYGAFWCSHCFEQKQMFGREALKYLDYVECYPEGYRQGIKIAKACDAADIKGFPTWIIKGEMLSGEQELSDLARVAGFNGFNSSK